jgi:hypothetical protein
MSLPITPVVFPGRQTIRIVQIEPLEPFKVEFSDTRAHSRRNRRFRHTRKPKSRGAIEL